MAESMTLPTYGDDDTTSIKVGDTAYAQVRGKWVRCMVQAVTPDSAFLSAAGMVPAAKVYKSAPKDDKATNVANAVEELRTDKNEGVVQTDMPYGAGWGINDAKAKELLDGLWEKAYSLGVSDGYATAARSAQAELNMLQASVSRAEAERDRAKEELAEALAAVGVPVRVTATVVTKDDEPAEGVAVSVAKGGETVATSATEDGAATFELPIGTYTLHSMDGVFDDVGFEVAAQCAEPPTAKLRE